MKHVKRILYFLLLCSIWPHIAQSQESIPATGGTASGSGGSATYTAGQLFYHMIPGTTGSVTEGVQQPYEISVVTGLEDAVGIDLICAVYPIPAGDFLILRFVQTQYFTSPYDKNGTVKTQYFASLYDINGKVLSNTEITRNETSIPLNEFPSGIYFLKILQKRHALSQPSFSPEEIKTFKIIKK